MIKPFTWMPNVEVDVGSLMSYEGTPVKETTFCVYAHEPFSSIVGQIREAERKHAAKYSARAILHRGSYEINPTLKLPEGADPKLDWYMCYAQVGVY